MSEGWGDFNALMLMSRDGDNLDGTFGAGLYALTAGGIQQSGFVADPGFFGIRRFTYSSNRAKNALSFRHISTSSRCPTPHRSTGSGRQRQRRGPQRR